MKKIFFHWLPVFLYCGLIYFMSSRPAPRMIPKWRGLDKVLHFSGYALLGILFLRAFLSTRLKAQRRKILLLSIFFASLYGASDEFHQSFVPSRDASLLDLVADIFGSAFGVVAYGYLLRVFNRILHAEDPDLTPPETPAPDRKIDGRKLAD